MGEDGRSEEMDGGEDEDGGEVDANLQRRAAGDRELPSCQPALDAERAWPAPFPVSAARIPQLTEPNLHIYYLAGDPGWAEPDA